MAIEQLFIGENNNLLDMNGNMVHAKPAGEPDTVVVFSQSSSYDEHVQEQLESKAERCSGEPDAYVFGIKTDMEKFGRIPYIVQPVQFYKKIQEPKRVVQHSLDPKWRRGHNLM